MDKQGETHSFYQDPAFSGQQVQNNPQEFQHQVEYDPHCQYGYNQGAAMPNYGQTGLNEQSFGANEYHSQNENPYMANMVCLYTIKLHDIGSESIT